MPRKQWTAFEKVTAADVSTYLSDQSVMTFATTTDRNAAIPSPSTGMQSAVTASPDLGAPRYWDGSTWVLIASGFTYPNVFTIPSNGTDLSRTNYDSYVYSSANVWQTLYTAGSDQIILSTVGQINMVDFDIGVGASGSEVQRGWHHGGDSVCNHIYGIRVANGERVAVRFAGTGNPWFRVNAATGALVSAAQYGYSISGSLNNTAAWVEVAATPPLAAGVWVIGMLTPSNFNQSHRLGTGGSGSETAVTGYISYSGGQMVTIVPIWWPPSTRLAIQSSTAAFGAGTARIVWRESLT